MKTHPKSPLEQADLAIQLRHKNNDSLLEILKPVTEYSIQSSNLIVGYVGGGLVERERMVPYLHRLASTRGDNVKRIMLMGIGSDPRNDLAIFLLRSVLTLATEQANTGSLEITTFPATELQPEDIPNLESSGPEASALKRAIGKELLRLKPHLILTAEIHPSRLNLSSDGKLTFSIDSLKADNESKTRTLLVNHFKAIHHEHI